MSRPDADLQPARSQTIPSPLQEDRAFGVHGNPLPVDYRGQLVYTTESDGLFIEVVDTDLTRALHFGTPSRQSCMWLQHPHRLQLPYTRAMMSFLLLLPEAPQRVLLLGLGGGSIAKFLLRGFPDCEIDAVEHNAEVVRIAHRYFAVPHTDRLRVCVDEAEGFVIDKAQAGHYDAVLVDAFDAFGAAGCVAQQSFIDACRRTLAPRGVLALNLWRGRNTGYRKTIAALTRSFARRPLRVRVPGHGNTIGLATKDPRAITRLRDLGDITGSVHRDVRLDFDDYRQQLERQRGWLGWLKR